LDLQAHHGQEDAFFDKMKTIILETKELRKSFYGFHALDNVDIYVYESELLGIMGPNGSGKSTFLDCITGVLKPSGGQVFFMGENITDWKASSVYKLGIGRTFQLVQLFPEMSVLDNILGAAQESKGNVFRRLFRFSENEEYQKATELLKFLRIFSLKDEYAKNLSYGQQKLLDLGMVLMSDPSLILLDEPLAGVNPTLGREIIDRLVRLINNKACTVVIIEHNARLMLEICHRIIVLDEGRKLAEGTPAEIENDEEVLKAYFGA